MPQIRNFAEAHSVLNKYVDRKKTTGNYTLDRMKKLMTALGNPQDNYKVIHVAGTSGKTSTCYYLAALLRQAGQKVGLTVSPHVDEVNERVQINLQPLSEEVFCKQLSEFINLVDQTGLEPSYFELLVAFAFWQFDKQKVDYAVVEVGLGGLLDGTNVIHRPDKICVITDIGLDHTNVLGKTISEITTQKAGIIQDHNPVFMYKQSDDVMEQVIVRCAETHSSLHEIFPEEIETEDVAPFKKRNYFLAKNVYDFIARNVGWPLILSQKLDKIIHLTIPARMEEIIYHGKTLIFDGSHNSQKMAALVEGIKALHPDEKVAGIVSFVKNENKQLALHELKDLNIHIIVTTFKGGQDTPKQSNTAKEIQHIFKEAGFTDVTIAVEPKAAFAELMKRPEKILLVTGSFYLLNHIRPLIIKR